MKGQNCLLTAGEVANQWYWTLEQKKDSKITISIDKVILLP